MAKALSLLFLRVSTGLLLVVWGIIRLGSVESGQGVANKYYGGLASAAWMQTAWGIFMLALGLLVVFGLLRRVVYPLQALVLVGGALAIWKYLLDPLGLWLLDDESRQVLFFPSLGMAAATLVLLAFRADDTINLDTKFGKTPDTLT